MGIIKKIFNKLNDRKAVTGTDIAAAITVIVLTIGIVTSIYVNAINKSKDNLRYANAVRIATNIMENIQASDYKIVTTLCDNTITAKNGQKIFSTKVPNGFIATVTTKQTDTTLPDIARDVIVSVKYKASMTYKTVTLTSVKERELMDMTNAPDISLIPGYGTSGQYFYPVMPTDANKNTFKITTTTDINWFDYEEGKYALIYKTTSGNLNVGATTTDKANIYAWVPRFAISGTTLNYLYGTSDAPIVFKEYNKVYSYGVEIEGTAPNLKLKEIASSAIKYFKEDNGLKGYSGVWHKLSGGDTTEVANVYGTFKGKVLPTNFMP